MIVGSLPQATLFFLFSSVFFSLLLHVERLPIWLLVFSTISLVWRSLMFRGILAKPHWILKLVLVSSGFAGIYYSYGTTVAIESMVSLLIAGIMLKPLEVEGQKDAYILIFLNYFLCSLIFLFDQSPLDFFLVIVVILFTLSAQVMIHQFGAYGRILSVKAASIILLKSLPLAVFLFFVLPRIGPLWTLSIPTQSGVVGLSDTVSPGSIASLGKTDELAFRVKFLSGDVKPNNRYWRAMTLSDYDGRQWKRNNTLSWVDRDFPVTGNLAEYEVIIEPHERNWLFTLGTANDSSESKVLHDGTMVSKRKVYNQLQYKVTSTFGPWLFQSELTQRERQTYTRIPKSINPRAQAFAASVFQQVNGDVFSFLDVINQYIAQQEFVYTLEPGKFDGEDQIDDFLFESKSGFCTYYAGSLAFLLRSAAIPSRLVAGYLGGEENTLSNTFNVYQYDAHAWVEVWIENKGWFRVDPTSWVSPERIESGLQQAIGREAFSGFKGQAQWLIDLRRRWQAFDYYWNDWMLSYKGSNQQTAIQNVFGERTAAELTSILLICFFALLLILFAWYWLSTRSRPASYESRIYNQLDLLLREHKNQEIPSMTLNQMFALLNEAYPNKRELLKNLQEQLEQKLYSLPGGKINKPEFKRLTRQIKGIKV